MVRLLMKICLKDVCDNLNLNYEICKMNNLKIPQKTLHEILNFRKKCKKVINADEVKIFIKKFSELSYLNLNNKLFNLNNYDFLNNHQLESFSIMEINNFQVTLPNFKLFIKNLVISDVRFFINSTEEERKNFFKYSLHVENSIIFDFLKFDNNSKQIFYLLEKSYEKLKVFKIINCSFDGESMEFFLSKIFLLENLQEFHFFAKVEWELEKELKNIKLMKKEREFGKNLKRLHIPHYFFLINKFMFENLKNLEFLEITCSLNGSTCTQGIFKTLSETQLPFLRECHLRILKSDEIVRGEIVDFLKTLRKLRKISLSIFLSDSFKIETFNSLINSRDTLQNIYLSPNFQENREMFFKEFFLNL